MASSLRELEADPALYIYTSLTAGSSHIVTATSRLETILRANRIPFKAVDMATNDKARMLWGRRAGKDPNGRVRKLPALVQEGFVVGDIVEIEEWNEYGELKQHVTIYQDEFTQPPIGSVPPKPKYGKKKKKQPDAAADAASAEASGSATSKAKNGATESAPAQMGALPIRTLAEEAAAKAKEKVAAAAKTATKAVSSAVEPKEEEKGDNQKEEQKEEDGKKADVDRAEAEKPVTAAALAPSATIEPAAAASKTPKSATVEDEENAEGGKKPTAATTETTPATPKEPTAAREETTKKPTTKSPTTTTNPIPIPAPSSPAAAQPSVPAAAFGLQSPTSGGWKDDSGASLTVQSPTSTTWQPTDVDAPITSLQGALIASASEEEIKQIERAQTIKEVPDEEVDE
ncbi:hypothetical protein QBC32DRAFT_371572 [Pseudoneurospora amorphoporcata]|uniref:Uncharacterized protein n=1 Tax=Pseudoneurospora amorphoporcata TaxID=241081 RepID=A0AAN6NS88_9PEZI|nr:hypothetical protein QBC32DRAFT_371572 [Pseudoneurospora amorphoporcata]